MTTKSATNTYSDQPPNPTRKLHSGVVWFFATTLTGSAVLGQSTNALARSNHQPKPGQAQRQGPKENPTQGADDTQGLSPQPNQPSTKQPEKTPGSNQPPTPQQQAPRTTDSSATNQPAGTTNSPPPADLQQPVLKNKVQIVYPESLRQLNPPPAGQILVKYVVGIDGIPKELEVIKRIHPVLDSVVLNSIRDLRYEPAIYKGQKVELVLSMALDIEAPVPVEESPSAESEPPLPSPESEQAETKIDSPEPANLPIRISGVILEAGDRQPVSNASIIAIPSGDLPVGRIKKKIYGENLDPQWTIRDETNEIGQFELRGVPDGRVRLIIQSDGFERSEYVVELGKNEQLELKYFQMRSSEGLYRTTVDVMQEQAPEVTRRTIRVEEISKIPGTQGDALKSIQSFPGVARAPFISGQLLIRGAAPEDSRTYFANHEIPRLFHFGGLTSVVNADVLEQIDFIPGNFDSRYGDATGGIVNVVPRKGRRDGYHGYVDSDIIDTGVLLQGPVGKGSFILSGRRSYVDLILPAVIPDDAGLNFSIAPRYWDYQAAFDYPILGGEFTARAFGSDDRTKLIFSNENDESTDTRNRVETTDTFHRADLAYRKVKGPWQFLISPSYSHNFLSFTFSDFLRFNLTSDSASGRAELTRKLSEKASLTVGADIVGGKFTIDLQAPPVPEDGSNVQGPARVRKTTQDFFTPAVYATVGLKLGSKFTLYPGVRFSYYTFPRPRPSTDPRLRMFWQVGEKTNIKAGVGIYSQSTIPQRQDTVFGNPQLGLEQSLHTSAGVEHLFPKDVTLEVTGFYKHLWNLVESSDAIQFDSNGQIRLENYANTGVGRIYGAELLLRKSLTRNLFGWISYTLMKSERKPRSGEPFILFDFDQTHILTLIASYKLPHRWQIGARFRVVSGNPQTPITDGIFDASSGSFTAIQGKPNSSRQPTFHQLDLRVDKTWVYKRLTLTSYIDILNAYNAENAEFTNYSYDFRSSQPITSLPIIPSFGLKLEF